MTTAGELNLSRIYLRCVKCGDGSYAADDRLGIGGRYSCGVQRLACLAASSWSYDISSDRLAELCGIRIGDSAIREIAQQHGAAMNAWQNADPEGCREFREAEGDIECTTDGTCVNTTGGWREMPPRRFDSAKFRLCCTVIQTANGKRSETGDAGWASSRSDNRARPPLLNSGVTGHCRLPNHASRSLRSNAVIVSAVAGNSGLGGWEFSTHPS
jgi:hypothetical protein